MRTHSLLIAALMVAPLTTLGTLAGCDKKKPAPPAPAKADDHDHGPGEEHGEHEEDHAGPVIDLGEQAIGAFGAKVTRDQGEIIAGKDAPVDVIVTPAAGSEAKVAAVRIWVGAEDARGSVKAKAEIENAEHPDHWHVHVEIPSPLPAGSKVWVEIEDDAGATSVGGFDLKN